MDFSNFCQGYSCLSALHPIAKRWADHLPHWDRTTPLDDVTIFTDGSFQARPASAAWAVVAVGWHHCSAVFVGFLGGRLFPTDHLAHVGQTQDDAHTAELVALLYTMAAVACCDNKTVTLVGDCTSALDVARVEAKSHAQPLLATSITDLHLIARERADRMASHHVHSHEGAPGNEFADSVAKSLARGEATPATACPDFCRMIRCQEFAWLWWTVSGACQRLTLPGFDECGTTLPDCHAALPRFHGCATLPGVPATQAHSATCADSAEWLMRTVTCNANSL